MSGSDARSVRGPSRVTMKDIATAAGVSTATVSRVLSNQPGAGDRVRDHVRKVASDLGYRGDSIARSLRMQRSHTVGVIVPDITNPFFPALIQSVEQHFERRHHSLLLADSHQSVTVEADRARSLLERRIDALVISPCDQRGSRRTIDDALAQIPVVQVDRRTASAAPYVGVDHESAVADVVEHLASHGRRRLGFLGYAKGVSTSEARLQAFVRHAGRLDTAAPTRVLREPVADDTIPAAWLDQHLDAMDGVVVTSDLLAVSLLTELARRDVAVPRDLAVVSFDNTVLAHAAHLTSVEQPLDLIATAVAQLTVGDDAPIEAERLPTRLVLRRSCGCSASRRRAQPHDSSLIARNATSRIR